jgi:kumamolisin
MCNLWTPAAIDAIEDLFAALTLRGVTIVVSSGDLGPLIHYPASSAFVMTCGGTQNPAAAETVWNAGNNASGGGISNTIPMPDWQKASIISCEGPQGPVQTDKRCLPDVAAWAIYSSDQVEPNQGTSAAAPIWSGLMALANQRLQAELNTVAGNINRQLYAANSPLQDACNDINDQRNNSITGGAPYFKSTKGWDACTGWGSPRVIRFIEALAKS